MTGCLVGVGGREAVVGRGVVVRVVRGVTVVAMRSFVVERGVVRFVVVLVVVVVVDIFIVVAVVSVAFFVVLLVFGVVVRRTVVDDGVDFWVVGRRVASRRVVSVGRAVIFFVLAVDFSFTTNYIK